METGFSTTSLNLNNNTFDTPTGANLLKTSNSLSTSSSDSLLGGVSLGRSSSNFGSLSLNSNIIVGNNASVIPGDNPQSFAAQARNALDKFVTVVFDRLNDKFVSEGGDKKTYSIANENPFANGNNPFGEGNMPELPARDFLVSQFGENFPLPSPTENGNASGDISSIFLTGNSPTTDSDGVSLIAANANSLDNNPSSSELETGSSNAVTDDGSSNPFLGDSSDSTFIGDGSSNPFTDGGASNSLTGGSENPFAGASVNEALSGTLNYVIDLRESFRSMGSNSLFGGNSGNESPLNSPSELLRLFRSDMAGFGLTVESFTNFVGENNPFAGTSNPFAGENPFASDGNETAIENLDGRLFKFLGWALEGLLPFTGTANIFQTPEGELPIGYGNREFGSGNATIGNANRDYGTNNASIGNNNWNWDAATGNATIGNGNWNFSSDNKTVGNGNWNLDYSSGSNTFGNGNWNIGSNNSTLGNGNYNFGSNNLVIGNGNWVFTDNSIVIGNGNWSVVLDNTPANQLTVSSLLEKVNNLALGAEIKSVVDDLVSTTVTKMGNLFYGLTDDFYPAEKETFDKVIRNEDAYTMQNPFASLASV